MDESAVTQGMSLEPLADPRQRACCFEAEKACPEVATESRKQSYHAGKIFVLGLEAGAVGLP